MLPSWPVGKLPDVVAFQVTPPSVETRMRDELVGLLPAATKVLLPKATAALTSLAVAARRAVQLVPSLEVKTAPKLPTLTKVPPPAARPDSVVLACVLELPRGGR